MAALRILLLATVAAATPVFAFAQTTPTGPQPQPTTTQPPQTPPAEDSDDEEAEDSDESTVEEITVTASRSTPRTSIESISYSTADDLQAASGTLAEALRNIPSVDVDPQGGVTLRGEGVTILIDGRPSALFSGPGRGPAILQTPASRFTRIEVMTNPSAAFRPDGSGGIINLISNPDAPRPGDSYSGSVRANIGTDGRYNTGLSVSTTIDRLTLTGDIGVRHDQQAFTSVRERERFDTGSSAFVDSRQETRREAPSDSTHFRIAAEYDFNEQWQLNADLNHFEFDSSGVGVSTFEEDDAFGNPATAYERRGSGGYAGTFSGGSLRLLRQYGEEHDWTNELRYDTNGFDNAQNTQTLYTLPVGPSLFEQIANDSETRTLSFSSAYRRPLGEDQKLRLGYEVELTDLDSDNIVRRGPSEDTVVVDPASTNRFQAEQAVHALYGTWERPLTERLTAQFGARVEYATRQIDQLTSGESYENDYFRVYPTLHVEYALVEGQTLRGSYSRRVQRPQPDQLNPFVVYIDPQNFSSGNPDLLPQLTDSFELAWTRRAGQTFYQATAYYRNVSDAFSSEVIDLGDGVLLGRPANLGASRSIGVEFVANGRLHPTLRYNASINIYNQAIDASNIVGGSDRDTTTGTGRINFNWTPTADDFIQIGGTYRGATIYAQGESEGSGSMNFGYRRRINDDLSLSFTVRDLLDSQRSVSTYETPTIRDRSEGRWGGRTAFIGFTWTFGQQTGRPQQPAFDFQGAPGGGGGPGT